jgi:hypothetical protein
MVVGSVVLVVVVVSAVVVVGRGVVLGNLVARVVLVVGRGVVLGNLVARVVLVVGQGVVLGNLVARVVLVVGRGVVLGNLVARVVLARVERLRLEYGLVVVIRRWMVDEDRRRTGVTVFRRTVVIVLGCKNDCRSARSNAITVEANRNVLKKSNSVVQLNRKNEGKKVLFLILKKGLNSSLFKKRGF